MKKCPACDSVAMDQDLTCGVCGNDLSSAVAMDESSLDQPVAHAPSPEPRRLKKTALMVVLTGPVLSIIGLVLLLNLLNLDSEPLALSGLVILILGLSTTMGVVHAGPLFRGWRRYSTRSGRRSKDKYGSYDLRPREVEAEESQSSPEEQAEDYRDREERKKERFD